MAECHPVRQMSDKHRGGERPAEVLTEGADAETIDYGTVRRLDQASASHAPLDVPALRAICAAAPANTRRGWEIVRRRGPGKSWRARGPVGGAPTPENLRLGSIAGFCKILRIRLTHR